jgi:hypothetical protein
MIAIRRGKMDETTVSPQQLEDLVNLSLNRLISRSMRIWPQPDWERFLTGIQWNSEKYKT